MSQYDIADIIEYLKNKYPHLETMEKVCSASMERQKMVKDIRWMMKILRIMKILKNMRT